MPDTKREEIDKFEIDELLAWGFILEQFFLDVLNGELPIKECRENLSSFRNSRFYTGSNPKYKKIIED